MSADNELVIAEFTDCWVVKQQFASHWWDVDVKAEDPDVIRELFKNGMIFMTYEDANKYTEEQETSHYYEYGSSEAHLDYPFMV